jgi:hypothetical protein
VLERPRPSRRARWQANYRRRQREGAKLIEVPAGMVELLIVSAWLKPHEADDKLAIRDALDAFAKSALKNFC